MQSKALSLSLVMHLQTLYKGALCLLPGRGALLGHSHEGDTLHVAHCKISSVVPTWGKSILHNDLVPLDKSE